MHFHTLLSRSPVISATKVAPFVSSTTSRPSRPILPPVLSCSRCALSPLMIAPASAMQKASYFYSISRHFALLCCCLEPDCTVCSIKQFPLCSDLHIKFDSFALLCNCLLFFFFLFFLLFFQRVLLLCCYYLQHSQNLHQHPLLVQFSTSPCSCQ